ncbi:MAG: protease modulator HflC [Gammaproteobacteria bacterium]|nr:protease modulator HflC [Gammaproteobacteria bacterium]
MTRRVHHAVVALAAVILLVALNATLYTVREGQVAVVTRFGRVIQGGVSPGLHGKIPFADSVHIFDGRLRTLLVTGKAVLTRGKRRVKVDTYVKWRIADARRYLAAVGGERRVAEERLQEVVASALRNAFGGKSLQAAAAGQGHRLVATVDRDVADYGIRVVDVRLVRIGLSGGMISTLDKKMEGAQIAQAQKITAQAMEDAEAIRAQADQKRAAVLADAYVKAEKIRGAADAEATTLYAAAYGRHPHFFVFYRSLRAYEKGFANAHTVLILGPDSDLLRYLPIAGR